MNKKLKIRQIYMKKIRNFEKIVQLVGGKVEKQTWKWQDGLKLSESSSKQTKLVQEADGQGEFENIVKIRGNGL